MDPDQAMQDFLERRKNYMSVYEPVDDSDGPHLKIINSKQFIVNSIRGYLPLKVVHFVMNLHTLPRTFYLTRHGQSEYNVLGKIGGDAGLSPNGLKYAKRLAQFAKDHIAKASDDESTVVQEETGQVRKGERPCRLWTSTMRRTKETAQFIEHHKLTHEWDNGDSLEWVQFRPMARRNLDELYAGVCDGMTYKEIEKAFPVEFQRRQDDKLAYRYPRGKLLFVYVCNVDVLTCRVLMKWIHLYQCNEPLQCEIYNHHSPYLSLFSLPHHLFYNLYTQIIGTQANRIWT
jgi:broad specificity phosphatase PhoE